VVGLKLKKKIAAQKLETKYTWKDIVLPAHRLIQLKELCNQVKYRNTVFGKQEHDKKSSIGKGLFALFSGASGTGKTMAAEIIANELRLDIYKIDLSQVVSKYIGETEKNLQEIFDAAEQGGAILFFDEADALFGKRSEVKDSHDRYANIEVNYLLQRMEEYEGIAILTTNKRQNMDEAFVRRMQIIVEFQFPDEHYRKRIWEVIFSRKELIGKNSLSDDVDFGTLARDVKLTGGNIKNIALMAAYYAAEKNEIIQMKHIVKGVRREYQKIRR
jgi:SpoVK/Ycf46/Vps4 family AAA+-type ATPase